MGNTVTIATEEYSELVKRASIADAYLDRVDAFAKYVNAQNYDIDREVCGAIFGFEVVKNGVSG